MQQGNEGRSCPRESTSIRSHKAWGPNVTVSLRPDAQSDEIRGQWITFAPLTTAWRQFEVLGAVRQATLHLTSQGLVRASINELPVNGDHADANRTDFVRALFRSYDVTQLILAGANQLGMTVSLGEWERTGLDPRVLAELVIELTDGSRLVVGTGEDMTSTTSAVVAAQPFYIERQDATATLSPAASPTVLVAAQFPTGPQIPPASVLLDPSPPIHVVGELRCDQLSATVFALGTNIAGRSRITLPFGVVRGTVIRVVHGEHLDVDGRVDTTNLTMPFDHGRRRQVVEYVATGEAGQVLEPWFCYHGFAYLEVTGLPEGTQFDVVARPLHSDLKTTSTLTTDEPLIDELMRRARRTLLNNVHGIPEDCPTREQSGWTGDTASVTDFEFASFDMASFFDKWLGDLRTSQQPNGAIPAIVPDLRTPRVAADPVWGAAVQRVLLGHWLTYGDRRVLDENIEMLRRWVDFQLTLLDSDGVVGNAPISYGHDWLALEQTPPRLLHTGAAADSLASLIRLEGALGNDPSERRGQLEQLRVSARERFVDASARVIGSGSQGSLAVALNSEWLDPELASWAQDALERSVRDRGNRVSSGFAATRTVVRALANGGRSQVLMDALQQPTEPGIGAMLTSGPGTFWENWWIDPTNTGTGSLDHIGLGGPFAGWAEQYLAGVQSTGPGFATFDVRPQFVRDVTRLDYELETVRGAIAVSYRRSSDTVLLLVTVPEGSEAEVVLPGTRATVGPGTHEFAAVWRPEPKHPVTETEPWQPPTRCMPVPHAQVNGPITEVAGSLRRETSYDLTDATFVYAEIDTCASGAEPKGMHLTVFSADGTFISASGTVWPAGWNRIAVDIGDWAGRMSVTAVEVGVKFDDPSVTFLLGAVGPGFGKRTW